MRLNLTFNNYLRSFFAKITVLFLVIAFVGCNAVKRVGDNELLLTKNTILDDGEKVTDADIQSLYYQEPNSSLFGFPLRLHIYNVAKPKSDSIYPARLAEKLKDTSFAERLYSRKQLVQFTKFKMGLNDWFRRTGEQPVVISELQTKKTADRIQSYLKSKGFFNNQVAYSIVDSTTKKKRGEVIYTIDKGDAYYVDSISQEIASKDVDSLYNKYKRMSLIKSGEQYDLSKFQNERDRLVFMFRNSGIYNFQQNSIYFELERDTVPSHRDFKMPTKVIIDNLTEREGDSIGEIPYKVHTIKKVNVYADYSFNDNVYELDSVKYKNYTIYFSEKLRYRPKAITDAISINEGDIYRDLERTATYRQLSNLSTFKYPNIEFKYVENDSTSSKLISNIYLTARDRFSLGFDVDISTSNIQDIGTSFSTAVIARNVFRGAETLKVSGRGTLGSQKSAADNDRFFNISEFGGDISLTFPRFFFPIPTDKWIPKSMIPKTEFSVGTSVQTNIGLDKTSFLGSMRYSWEPSRIKKVAVELFNIQYIRNKNVDNFFNVYQSTYDRLNNIADNYAVDPSYFDDDGDLTIPSGSNSFISDVLTGQTNLNTEDTRNVRSINERRDRLTENNLIVATNVTYTVNNKRGLLDNEFFQFRTKFEVAGNTISLLSNTMNLDVDADGRNLLFNVAYSQYVKGEFDYVKYFQLAKNHVLAFRSFAGLAIPYGNAGNIPFSRSYFAGGTNDNRGWQAYSLGPGRTGSINDFNEANFKLAFNAEYRFPIAGAFKGAFFADAGNIWNWLDDVEDEEATFNGLKSLQDVALATGIGFRYDAGFFVFRLDTGFKTYNPAYEMSRRWFTDFNLSEAVLNIGINYPF